MSLLFMRDFMPADKPQEPNPPLFDPMGRSEQMQAIAAFAQRCIDRREELEPAFIQRAYEQLLAAQAWFDAHCAEFNIGDQLPVVTAGEAERPVVAEALIYTLRYTAIKLLHHHKHLEVAAFPKKT